jgi:hypothetical protein
MRGMQSSSRKPLGPGGQPKGIEHSPLLKNGAAPEEIGAD